MAFLASRLDLSRRLLLLGFGSTLLIMGIGGWILRENVHAAVMRGFEARLDERAERVLARLDVAPGGQFLIEQPRSGDEFGQIFSGWYWQITGKGVRMRSRSMWDAGMLAVQAGMPLRAEGPRGEALLGIVREVTVADKPVTLTVFGPAAEIDRELTRLDHLLALTLLLVLLALSMTTLAQVRVGLRPLRRLREAVATVRDGTAQAVGEGYGPDLDPLARELDEMLARNARIVARGRAHAADLSHALKKPLALLGAEAGFGAQVDSRYVLEQVRGMSALIDRHLTRAASSAGSESAGARHSVALSACLSPLLGLMRNLHQGRGLIWESYADDSLLWRGEMPDLEEMLGNLLDNAGKWAKTRVRVSAQGHAREIVVLVEDDGPGLNEAQIARVARRGQRFDESVEGSGLGLAITADIAETYDGRLTFERSELGGLCAILELPN